MSDRIRKLRFILLGALSVAIVAIMSIIALILYHATLQSISSERLNRLQLLSQEIIYLDEVLTMSARVGIFKNAPHWQQRYNHHSELLDKALVEAIKQEPVIAEAVYNTSKANTKLINLETRAFELVSQGEQKLAADILFSEHYRLLKEEYALGIQQAIKTLQDKELLLQQKHHAKTEMFILALLIVAIVFLTCWLYLLFYIRQSDQKMHYLAVTDQLTGLLNRRLFDENLSNEFNRCKRENRKLMVAIIDIDLFKSFNDSYGHPKGDQVLKQIGTALNQATRRSTEFAYRIGGEGFAVITSIKNHTEGLSLAKTIFEKVMALKIPHKENRPHCQLTISMGITFLSDNRPCDAHQLYREADQALYIAKSKGRNQYIEFVPE